MNEALSLSSLALFTVGPVVAALALLRRTARKKGQVSVPGFLALSLRCERSSF
jgi:hypothetical protein